MIRKVISLFFLLTASGVFLPVDSYSENNNTAQQEFFPFVAEVISENVNIRAGQSENFEKLIQLNTGDIVYVIERSYSWYKIRLPENVAVYIHKKYLDVSQDAKTGVVNADRINLRAKKGIDSTIVGQIEKGEKVFILEQDKEWAAVKPTVHTSGWVKDSYIRFKSKDVSMFEKQMSAPVEINAVFEPSVVKKEVVVQLTNVFDLKKKVSVVGHLEKKEITAEEKVEYIFFVDDQPAYTVSGDHTILDEFLYYKVKIEGLLDNSQTASRPIINLSKIELIY